MSDIDEKVAAAWHSASREDPPAALDSALRAAARRAVHAGPARTRHMRTWPLAAAAVVAVLAIGLLQLTPPKEVTPGMIADSTMRQLPEKKSEAALPATPTETRPTPAPSAAATVTPPAQSTSAPAGASRRTGPSASEFATASKQVAQARPAPSAPLAPSLDRLREKPNVASDDDLGAAKLRARADAKPDQEPKLPAARDARETAAAAPASRAEPFPATGAKDKSLAEMDAASVGRAQAGAISDSPVAPPAAPAPPAAVAANEAAKPRVTAANAMRAEESQARTTAPMALAKNAAAPERVKDAAVKPPEEWIKLIRRLKSEGRNDEATKELAAFRAAYKERADSLLPSDLRDDARR